MLLLFLVIINNAAMNIHIQIFCVDNVFNSPAYIPRSEVGSYGNFLLNLLRNCQTIFQSSCTILHSCQHCMMVLLSPHLCQLLSLSFIYYCNYLSECQVVSCMHFCNVDVKFFTYFLAFCISYLEKYLFGSFSYFNWIICLFVGLEKFFMCYLI